MSDGEETDGDGDADPQSKGGDAGEAKPVSLFAFRLAGEGFAVLAEHVETLLDADLPRTQIPTAPAHVPAVIQHRGQALAILDLIRFLGIPAAEVAEPRLAIVRAAGMRAAIPVGAVQLLTAPGALRAPETGMRYALGLLDREAGAVQVLDLERLLRAAAPRRGGA